MTGVFYYKIAHKYKIFTIFVKHLPSVAGGWIVRETRTRYVNVRFSENEFCRLSSLMSLSGYNNRSKFIRETILSRRVRRKNLICNESNLIKQIDLLRLDIKRIGVNYNQRVRALNTIASRADNGGALAIQYGYFEFDMTSMKHMMEDIVSKMNEIVDLVSVYGNDIGQSNTNETVQSELYDNITNIL